MKRAMADEVILNGLDGVSRLDLWVLAFKIMATAITAALSILLVVFTLSLRAPGGRERRAAAHFTLASLLATLYIGADAAVRAGAVFGSVEAILIPYRLSLSAIPLSIAAYIHLYWMLDPERASRRGVALALYAGTVLVAALVWIDHPLLIIASDAVAFTGTAVYADYGAAAPAFFALCLVLLAVMCRGLVPLARRMGGTTVWRLTVVGFAVLFATGLHDALRELGVLASPFGAVALGYAFFQVSTFAVLAIHYSRTLEDRQHQGLQLRRLTDAVVRDSHSGLFTRGFLEDTLNDLGTDAQGGLLFLDLDHFKAINDTYGHAIGDELIRAAAQRIRSNMRDGDMPCRWGGDEFVVYLPGTDAQALQVLADRLGEAFRAVRLAHLEHAGISVSMGWAQLTDGDWHRTLERADVAMYQAKQAGRDQLVIARGIDHGVEDPSVAR